MEDGEYIKTGTNTVNRHGKDYGTFTNFPLIPSHISLSSLFRHSNLLIPIQSIDPAFPHS